MKLENLSNEELLMIEGGCGYPGLANPLGYAWDWFTSEFTDGFNAGSGAC